MFGFLKKKLSEIADSISGKVKKKVEEPTEQPVASSVIVEKD